MEIEIINQSTFLKSSIFNRLLIRDIVSKNNKEIEFVIKIFDLPLEIRRKRKTAYEKIDEKTKSEKNYIEIKNDNKIKYLILNETIEKIRTKSEIKILDYIITIYSDKQLVKNIIEKYNNIVSYLNQFLTNIFEVSEQLNFLILESEIEILYNSIQKATANCKLKIENADDKIKIIELLNKINKNKEILALKEISIYRTYNYSILEIKFQENSKFDSINFEILKLFNKDIFPRIDINNNTICVNYKHINLDLIKHNFESLKIIFELRNSEFFDFITKINKLEFLNNETEMEKTITIVNNIKSHISEIIKLFKLINL